MNVQSRLYDQLALDCGLPRSAFPLTENHFLRKQYLPGRRIYTSDNCLLQIFATDSHAVFVSTDAGLLDWCRGQFQQCDGAWIAEYDKIFRLNEKLEEYGWYIADGHPYFIPGRLAEAVPDFQISWLDGRELTRYRRDPRFPNAPTNDPARPDMLGVSAIVDGKLAGLAGASADSAAAWQIGIDVLPEYRGCGIATALTARLAGEIVKRGVLPFYGTGASHVLSQRVAAGAGFVPGWWELYTKEKRPALF